MGTFNTARSNQVSMTLTIPALLDIVDVVYSTKVSPQGRNVRNGILYNDEDTDKDGTAFLPSSK